MFATTAVQILRAAGYKTRLTSGFIVRKQDFIRTANQSVVSTENLHMWPEVCLDGTHWIPLEPAPGFPIPYSTRSIWQWLRYQAVTMGAWMVQHPLRTLAGFALLILLVWRRYDFLAACGWLAWMSTRCFLPHRQLRATRQLIDMRFWAAGQPRPRYATVKDWYLEVDPVVPAAFLDLWNVDNFCSQCELNAREVDRACRQLVSQLTLGRIRNHAKAKLSNPRTRAIDA